MIRSHFGAKRLKILLCAPTGSGKTVTFASMALDAIGNGFAILILTDRLELLQQAGSTLSHSDLNPFFVAKGVKDKAIPVRPCYVATTQTLIRRPRFISRLGRSQKLLIISDEAHKTIHDKIITRPEFCHAYVIGATATPIRRGKSTTPLGDIYDAIVEPISIAQLVDQGSLVPAITYGAQVDTSTLRRERGEFSHKAQIKTFAKAKIYADVVRRYKDLANGSKALVFCVNVKHTRETCEAFNAAGIAARWISGSTPIAEREAIVEAHKRGDFPVLCNCDILTTGYDDPLIQTVIVNRATTSVPLWLQMCGRGSRISSGKDFFTVVDMGGNAERLGLWEQPREWSLYHETGSDKEGVARLTMIV
jgi:superfamily II DNA or RNA helicase